MSEPGNRKLKRKAEERKEKNCVRNEKVYVDAVENFYMERSLGLRFSPLLDNNESTGESDIRQGENSPNRNILAPDAMVHMHDQPADRQSEDTPSETGPVEATGDKHVHPEPQKLNLTLWHISGNMLRRQAFQKGLQIWQPNSSEPARGTLMIPDYTDCTCHDSYCGDGTLCRMRMRLLQIHLL